jgi:c-di-GMP-related signal transduction protein
MGLLSAVDAFTDQTLAESVADIPLPADVTGALLGTDATSPLASVYSLALSFERGRVPRVTSLLANLAVPLAAASGAYRQAVAWADQSTVA